MIEAYKSYWVNAFDFKSSTSRSNYWLAILAGFIASFILGVILKSVFDFSVTIDYTNYIVTYAGETPGVIINDLWTLANLLPSLTICIRRLHDIGKYGWWVLVVLIPVVGWIWLLVLLLQPGKNN